VLVALGVLAGFGCTVALARSEPSRPPGRDSGVAALWREYPLKPAPVTDRLTAPPVRAPVRVRVTPRPPAAARAPAPATVRRAKPLPKRPATVEQTLAGTTTDAPAPRVTMRASAVGARPRPSGVSIEVAVIGGFVVFLVASVLVAYHAPSWLGDAAAVRIVRVRRAAAVSARGALRSRRREPS
jgi:hypothetical protein